MSISYYLQNAEEIIEKFHNGWRAEDVNDVIELYNIWLFVDNRSRGDGSFLCERKRVDFNPSPSSEDDSLR